MENELGRREALSRLNAWAAEWKSGSDPEEVEAILRLLVKSEDELEPLLGRWFIHREK